MIVWWGICLLSTKDQESTNRHRPGPDYTKVRPPRNRRLSPSLPKLCRGTNSVLGKDVVPYTAPSLSRRADICYRCRPLRRFSGRGAKDISVRATASLQFRHHSLGRSDPLCTRGPPTRVSFAVWRVRAGRPADGADLAKTGRTVTGLPAGGESASPATRPRCYCSHYNTPIKGSPSSAPPGRTSRVTVAAPTRCHWER